ncbi:MAG TPA: hypothetical protein VNL98_09410 [Gemmatimonadales bacterium]|nr:hypothetical protein [Gemmatimonadales bacterium]
MNARQLLGAVVLSLCTAGAASRLEAQAGARPDPRVGLRAGWFDAGIAQWNMRLVSSTPPADQLVDRTQPGDFRFIGSDLAFRGNLVVQGNFSGFQIFDISDPRRPQLVSAYVCPGAQNDVSVYRNLLFLSSEGFEGRTDCGTEAPRGPVSPLRMRGIRIFDIGNPAQPRPIANVQTCRGSHTHTLVRDPADTANVYIYVSGSAPVRPAAELAGCSGRPPEQDPNSALFRIEIIQVPLAAPEQARVVSTARIFTGLGAPPTHGPSPEDSIAAAREAAAARARGEFTVMIQGEETVVPAGFARPLLDSIARAGGRTAPNAADSQALREALPRIVAQLIGEPSGPNQCHDITVYSFIRRAGGACGGYGLLLDISDVRNPRRIGAAADSNFAFWHSATFNNDGTKVLFTDEWGGGLQARCRATDRREWGANAIFTLSGDTMTFRGYYKVPAPQTAQENCVAHNGSLVPVPGRDIMVQGWYQGGVSVFDFTDPARPVEIAFFDRGPMDTTNLLPAGSWSAYWYNGLIFSSDLSRGLDILELEPSELLSRNEIEAARLVRFDYFNPQDQEHLVWPAAFVVARAYVDQLERGGGLPASRITAVRGALDRAERAAGTARRNALNQLAAALERDAAGSSDAARIRLLIETVRRLAGR